MNICVFDIESLGSDTAYSSIAEFAAILYSDDFKELDRINIRCRIPEGEIPQCTALLVNRLDIKTLTSANYSHYQLINEVQKTFTKWSPCIFIGFSSIHFDEEMLRKEFFKNLHYPFLTNTRSPSKSIPNKRHDALNILRGAYATDKSFIKTELNEKGNVTMKLESISRLAGLDTTKSHSAIVDVENTKFFLEKVFKEKPNIWKSALMTNSKENTENLVKQELMFTSCEYYYGRERLHAVAPLHSDFFKHPVYQYLQVVDLKADIENIVKLTRSELKEEIKKVPKFLRSIRQAKAPIILNIDYALKEEPYNVIKRPLLEKRASIVKNNKEFGEKISSILLEIVEEKYQTDDQSDIDIVNSIYKKFTPNKDNALMYKWHNLCWEDKLKSLDHFTDDRLVHFGKKIIYQEAPQILPTIMKKEIMRDIAKRILSEEKQKWWTIKEFYHECDNLRQKAEEEKDENKLKFLNEINDYVEQVERKYSNA